HIDEGMLISRSAIVPRRYSRRTHPSADRKLPQAHPRVNSQLPAAAEREERARIALSQLQRESSPVSSTTAAHPGEIDFETQSTQSQSSSTVTAAPVAAGPMSVPYLGLITKTIQRNIPYSKMLKEHNKEDSGAMELCLRLSEQRSYLYISSLLNIRRYNSVKNSTFRTITLRNNVFEQYSVGHPRFSNPGEENFNLNSGSAASSSNNTAPGATDMRPQALPASIRPPPMSFGTGAAGRSVRARLLSKSAKLAKQSANPQVKAETVVKLGVLAQGLIDAQRETHKDTLTRQGQEAESNSAQLLEVAGRQGRNWVRNNFIFGSYEPRFWHCSHSLIFWAERLSHAELVNVDIINELPSSDIVTQPKKKV
ncbi:hypothetical protein K470DRAFT_263809, partial [Piedraia hortae CBS 480.64]